MTGVRDPTAAAVVRANVCVRGPLELKGKVISEMRGVADKQMFSARITNIILQLQYVLDRYVGNVFGSHSSICDCFSSTRKLVMYAKRTVWPRILYHPGSHLMGAGNNAVGTGS
jgi:hypothetical protein